MKKIVSALIICAMLCATFMAAIPAFAATDTAALNTLIKEVEVLYKEDFSAETWATLETALAAAKEALNATEQTAVDNAKSNLEAAKKGLKDAKVTRDMLKEKLDEAAALVKENYTKATWDTLQLAVEKAQEAYDLNSNLEIKIKSQFVALRDALRVMKYETAGLDAVIAKANTILEENTFAEKLGFGSDYTAATLDVFKAALTTAKTNVKSNDLEKINASITELNAAIEQLVANPAPQSMIDKAAALLDLADCLIATDWSDSAWGMVEIKVKQAKDAPNDPRVSVWVKAATELETALKNLTNKDKTSKEVLPDYPVVDTGYLDDLIKWCDDSLVEANYTAESWKIFNTAYLRAKEVSANPRKADNVYSAWSNLKAAKDKLVIDPNAKVDAPAETQAPAATEANNATTTDVVEVGCGGFIATTAVVMASVLALGAAVVAKKKED